MNTAFGNGQTSTRLHRFVAVQRITGLLLMVFSLSMLPPMLVDLIYQEDTIRPFLLGLWITLATGAVIWWPARHQHAELKTRDGFLITVLFWAVLGVFGAIPLYVADGAWHTYIDAVFESVSGLTTTGATTVAKGLDDLPHAVNYYRAQLHWLGGMGIIVLAVAVLPMLGVGGMQLYRAETPGPMKNSKLTPRITESARVLWLIYVALTVACALTYWVLGMSAFDAICHAFSTMATGGFSTHDASIGYFNSVPIELAAMFFMLIGALNFALHYQALHQRDLRTYWRDVEFRACLITVLLLTVLVFLPLYFHDTYPSPLIALRKAAFHVISYGSTTGYGTADPSSWPSIAPMVLVFSMFIVGCAGSTAGGVKVVRLVLFLKQALREVQRLVHPSSEVAIKLDRKVVPNDVVHAVGAFFTVYIVCTIVLTFLMITTGLDPLTAFSIVSAMINNSGPGLGVLNGSVAPVTEFGKCVLTFTMLLGRLEIFTLLIVFTPSFWRR